MRAAAERVRRTWRGFGSWRRGRPFAAGVFLVLAGVAIAVPPYATFRVGDVVVAVTTIGGGSAVLIGALLMACGLSLWLRVRFRVVAGTTALLLSLVALVTTNLGGLLIGTLLGVFGAALALAWTDQPRAPGGNRWAVFRRGSVVLGVISVVGFAAHTEPLASPDVTPARSWTLVADTLRMDGASYHGIDRIVVDGRSAPVMRFTAQELRITTAVQVAALGNGRELVITTKPGAVSTATGGIELFVLRLTGDLNLLNLVKVPVDFTPEHPPPLMPPSVVLTNVTAINAQLSGGVLMMRNARLVIR